VPVTSQELFTSAPMLLTWARLPIAAAYVAAYCLGSGPLPLLALVLAAVFSDFLDGYIARRAGAVTETGQLLDPLADMVFCLAVFATMADSGVLSGWMFTLFAAREAWVTAVLRPLAKRRGTVLAAGWAGKAKTNLQFFAMIAALARCIFAGPRILGLLPPVLFWAALAASFFSAGLYTAVVFRRPAAVVAGT
jgi:cardiolipin synthase